MSLHQLFLVQHGYDGWPRPLSFGPRFDDEWRLLEVVVGDKQAAGLQRKMQLPHEVSHQTLSTISRSHGVHNYRPVERRTVSMLEIWWFLCRMWQ